MHELSVAQEILEIVHQYVPDPKPNTVKSVKVKVGRIEQYPYGLTYFLL